MCQTPGSQTTCNQTATLPDNDTSPTPVMLYIGMCDISDPCITTFCTENINISSYKELHWQKRFTVTLQHRLKLIFLYILYSLSSYITSIAREISLKASTVFISFMVKEIPTEFWLYLWMTLVHEYVYDTRQICFVWHSDKWKYIWCIISSSYL